MNNILSAEQVEKVKELVNSAIVYVGLNTQGTPYYDEWYAGITGQDFVEDENFSKRKAQHLQEYPDLKYWTQWQTNDVQISREVERILIEKKDFEGDLGGGLKEGITTPPTIVYVFKMK